MEEIKRKRGRPKKGTSPTTSDSDATPSVSTSNSTVILDPVISPYRIWVDNNCYSIGDEKLVEGAMVDKTYGYYTTLGNALEKIAKMKSTNNKIYSLKEYVDEFKGHITAFRKVFEF